MTACQWCRLDSRRGFHSPDWCACLYQPSNDLDPASVYGPTCRCGRFRARHDTGKCEWCSAWSRRPWKQKRKPTKRKSGAS